MNLVSSHYEQISCHPGSKVVEQRGSIDKKFGRHNFKLGCPCVSLLSEPTDAQLPLLLSEFKICLICKGKNLYYCLMKL